MAQKDSSKQQSKNLLAVLTAAHPSVRLIQELSIWAIDQPSIKILKFLPDKVFDPAFSSGSTVGNTKCIQDQAIDIAGQSQTGDDGTMTWRLTDFICRSANTTLVEPPASFVATPISQSPVYLTTTIEFPEPAAEDESSRDLIVEVFTWDPGGSSAPRIPFSWRCRVRFEEKNIVD